MDSSLMTLLFQQAKKSNNDTLRKLKLLIMLGYI